MGENVPSLHVIPIATTANCTPAPCHPGSPVILQNRLAPMPCPCCPGQEARAWRRVVTPCVWLVSGPGAVGPQVPSTFLTPPPPGVWVSPTPVGKQDTSQGTPPRAGSHFSGSLGGQGPLSASVLVSGDLLFSSPRAGRKQTQIQGILFDQSLQ